MYTTLYFESHPPFEVSKALKIYEELLKPYGFVRTHRSHLVNKLFIRSVTSDTIVMQDASVARISRNKRSDCMQQLMKDNSNAQSLPHYPLPLRNSFREMLCYTCIPL